jgi:hypothetical protein
MRNAMTRKTAIKYPSDKEMYEGDQPASKAQALLHAAQNRREQVKAEEQAAMAKRLKGES